MTIAHPPLLMTTSEAPDKSKQYQAVMYALLVLLVSLRPLGCGSMASSGYAVYVARFTYPSFPGSLLSSSFDAVAWLVGH
jgi:hypothetical protein